MANKCNICKQKIEETFLKKIIGTYVRDKKGKRHTICSLCQKKYKKDELLQKL